AQHRVLLGTAGKGRDGDHDDDGPTVEPSRALDGAFRGNGLLLLHGPPGASRAQAPVYPFSRGRSDTLPRKSLPPEGEGWDGGYGAGQLARDRYEALYLIARQGTSRGSPGPTGDALACQAGA